MLACAKHVLGSEAAEKLKKIPLSNDTVKRRIREISENLEDQLVRHIKDIPVSIQLDESTFGADSTLIVCIRFIENECIKEELLFVDYFECRCTGQDIFKMVRSYFDSHEMKLSQVVSVSTDGARNMTGRETGFWGCFKREVPQCSFIHCMLHKQALAAENIQPELHETLNLVIKVVNFVKSSPLNERILRKLCEDSDAEHDALLFHTDVRWLSRGKTLERVYSIYDQLCEFLAEKHFFKAEEFSSIYFKLKLAYLTEIFSYYNLSNIRLQGDGIFIQAAIEIVTAFQNQLQLFRLRVFRKQWNMFPRVEAILSISPLLEVKFTIIVQEHLLNLATDFSHRFSDVSSIPKYLLAPMDILLEDMIDLENILIEELLYLQANEEAKAKYSCANKSNFWFFVKRIAPNLFKEAERLLLLPFPTTYFCEKTFSSANFLRSMHRRRLDFREDLRISVSKYTPEIEKLASHKQFQGSH